ncbi:hypothetical protein Gotur_012252 [Gossypium turneri]
MSSLPTNFQTWLGSMENWQWTQSYDEGFRLVTLMPKMGLRQAKQIEAGHMYVEAVRKAMAVNSRRAQTMKAELYSRDLETFRVQKYIGRRSDETYTLQCTLRIWGNEFPVMPDVSSWEVPPPTIEMVPDHSLRRHLKGRPQSTRIQNDMDIRETEAIAVLYGLQFALDMGFSKVILESDSRLVVNNIQKSSEDYSESRPFTRDVKNLARKFQCCRFQFIAREGNGAAHALAVEGM